MPELPTAESVFGRRVAPKSTRQVLGYEAGQEAKAAARQGEAMQDVGGDLDKLYEKRKAEKDKLEAAKAQSYVLKATTDLETQIAENPDYANHQKMWDEGYAKIKAGALSLVSADKRELFSYALDDINTSTTAKLRKNVYDLEGKAMAGEAVNTRDTMTGVAAEKLKRGDQAGALAAIQTAINATVSAQRAGAYSGMYDNGASILSELKSQMAEAALAQVPADKRVALLKPQYGPQKPDAKATLSVRNNNPGNIRGADGNFKVFNTKEEGLQAMKSDLSIKITGRSRAMKAKFGDSYKPTISNLLHTYAPTSENDTQSYINTVANETGISPDQILTEADIEKIMPAMIKVEGGTAASVNFSSVASFLPPDKFNKIMTDAEREDISGRIDRDPSRALLDLEDGIIGTSLDPSEIAAYKESARSAQEKSFDRAEASRFAQEITNDRETYGKFIAGEMDLAQVAALEARNGVTPMTKMMRTKLTSEPPERLGSDRLKEYDRLQGRLSDLRILAGGKANELDGDKVKLSVALMSGYKDFQDDVMRQVDAGFITASEGKDFIEKFSIGLNGAIEASRTGGASLRSGVQDPYDMAFKSFNSYLKSQGRSKDLFAKKELTMRFSDFLGDYESSGNTQKDRAVIDEAIRLTKETFAKDEHPSTKTLAGTPNAVLSSDGIKKGVSDQSDLKAKAGVSVPFTVMVDGNGNRARVYQDGRVEEIN